MPIAPAKYPSRMADRRGSAASRGYGARWRKFRLRWLAERPFCGQRRYDHSGEHSLCVHEGVLVPGTVVDHIIPHRGNQSLMWDEDNLQTLCELCHNIKSAKEGIITDSRTQVTATAERFIVTGPPGSGKTTWVEQHRKAGDLVFDLDAIAGLVCQIPVYPRPSVVVSAILSMRSGLIDWLSQNRSARAFIIVTDRQDADTIARRIGASVIVPSMGGRKMSTV